MSDVGLGMRFALAALGTWRVTHLLAREDGPGDAVLRIRARAGSGAVGDLMDCFYCLSVWVAAPFAVAIAPRRRDVPLACLALSGAACLLERVTTEKGELDVLWEQAQEDEAPRFDDTDPRLSGGPDRAREASTSR
jgi:hypothetical protein